MKCEKSKECDEYELNKFGTCLHKEEVTCWLCQVVPLSTPRVAAVVCTSEPIQRWEGAYTSSPVASEKGPFTVSVTTMLKHCLSNEDQAIATKSIMRFDGYCIPALPVLLSKMPTLGYFSAALPLTRKLLL